MKIHHDKASVGNVYRDPIIMPPKDPAVTSTFRTLTSNSQLNNPSNGKVYQAKNNKFAQNLGYKNNPVYDSSST